MGLTSHICPICGKAFPAQQNVLMRAARTGGLISCGAEKCKAECKKRGAKRAAAKNRKKSDGPAK